MKYGWDVVGTIGMGEHECAVFVAEAKPAGVVSSINLSKLRNCFTVGHGSDPFHEAIMRQNEEWIAMNVPARAPHRQVRREVISRRGYKERNQ